MTRQEIFEIIKKTKIIPAVKIENSDDAIHTAKALAEGGIKIVEFTYRTACAGEAISKVSQNCPDILTGAGTITDLKKAKDAVKSGAQFIVMPGFDEKTVDWCIKKNIPVIPVSYLPQQGSHNFRPGVERVLSRCHLTSSQRSLGCAALISHHRWALPPLRGAMYFAS